MVDVENGKSWIAYLKRYKTKYLVLCLVKLSRAQIVCMCEFVCEERHPDQGRLETYKSVSVKIKEKSCSYDVVINKWIREGLSVDEKSGLISWRVSKKIKIRDVNGRLISEPT